MSVGVLEHETMHPAATAIAKAAGSTWMQVLSHLDRSYGGLTAVVPALAAQLQRRCGMQMKLAAFTAPAEQFDAAAMAIPPSVWPAGHATWLKRPDLRTAFARELADCSGVHLHGLWDASTQVAARAAQRQGKPYIVSAHGMLEPWALKQKALKKRVYGALAERPMLQRAACLHALTRAEARDYRSFGCTQPIAIIPNAVEAPQAADPEVIEALAPEIAGRRVVLFLGRLHVKKGIELLLQAWVTQAGEFPDAVLLLAGPGEPAYVQQLQKYVDELGIRRQVLFTGMLGEAAKWSALQRAHVFVLPSYSEGLSVAALEALAIGTPVMVTDACNLPEVSEAGCGWQIAPDVQQLALALRASLGAEDAERVALGRRAKQLASSRFSWGVVCEQMAELYGCVLTGETPVLSLYQEAVR